MSQFRRFSAAAVLLVLLVSGAAFAQTQPEAPAPSDHIKTLIDVLRDDEARKALIDELEKKGAGEAATDPKAASDPAQPDSKSPEPETQTLPTSVGRQVAEFTKSIAENTAESFARLKSRITSAFTTVGSLDAGAATDALWTALKDLLLTILVTYALYFAIRALLKPVTGRMTAYTGRTGIQVAIAVLLTVLLDIGAVVAAWALGYLAALTVFGEAGTIGIRQTLYLNAFLIVELGRVLVRTIMSPATADLRWIDITDAAARYINSRIGWLIAILGYGQLLVLPIINRNVSFFAGRAFLILMGVTVLLLAAAFVLRNRAAVTEWLIGEPAPAEGEAGRRSSLARFWHLPVLAYLAGMLFIILARPDGMLVPALAASGKILAALLLAYLVMRTLARLSTDGVSVPGGVQDRLPLLQNRINRFVPAALGIVRLVLAIVVVAFILDVVGALDIREWLLSQLGIRLTAAIVSVALTLLVSLVIWLVLASWVDYRLNPGYGNVPSSREVTLLTLMRNAVTIVLVVITLMFVLSELGLDIAPLLASAGVLGLAIGFGAQKMVQDIITGVFIQFESAINVGDVVTLNGTLGTVERLTIRSVSLRDAQGAYHIIPFSSVDMVTNYMREFAYFVCDMGVAYRENTDEVRDAMLDAFAELKRDDVLAADMLGDMEWMGVMSFGDNAVVVRTRLKTKPGKQWAIGRAYNAIVKKVFDERGIEMPFPHRTIYFGEDKQGLAPPANVALVKDK